MSAMTSAAKTNPGNFFEDFTVGQTIQISTLQPVQDFEVVGIAK